MSLKGFAVFPINNDKVVELFAVTFELDVFSGRSLCNIGHNADVVSMRDSKRSV